MIAYKMRIIDLVNGKLKNDPIGGVVLSTPFGESKEARILGTIIDSYRNSENTYGSFTIDDGTATTRIKAWSDKVQLFDKFNVGELIDIIGRVGEFQDEIYITPDNIIPITPNYWIYRELEISKRMKELIENGLSFEYKEEIEHLVPEYASKPPQKEETYEEVTEEVNISEVEDALKETKIEELMEEVSEEAITKEITEESDDMSFYDEIDEDEIKESVYDLVKTDPNISKSEMSNVLSIDELDVELAIKDLVDDGRIKLKDDGFEIIE
ncbi:MAG: OB-fold nucleic acid binding domain protein [Candidatus Methanofastidiosum methylothiophilum]|uniref:OB-fold nucleic acid binding domain protein n=1 Tax=Candidatus Methanofastidiosum methylothiophilum TaxID=1705564 RepID=A0A150JC37_9EURY|nr:MAG: OB-fold nucleic acid binding domain protein [Candidatus Methanofastidiosum methylthiophilus]KYC58602.1 MAG: OB-fold nucleic acid binding domain protein [Candidatus Methanofastidiosum methylthiophilus]